MEVLAEIVGYLVWPTVVVLLVWRLQPVVEGLGAALTSLVAGSSSFSINVGNAGVSLSRQSAEAYLTAMVRRGLDALNDIRNDPKRYNLEFATDVIRRGSFFCPEDFGEATSTSRQLHTLGALRRGLLIYKADDLGDWGPGSVAVTTEMARDVLEAFGDGSGGPGDKRPTDAVDD